MVTKGKAQSWWTTLPGVLTAVAATVTAIAGLLGVLHQSGLIGPAHHGGEPQAGTATDAPSTTPPRTSVESPAPAAPISGPINAGSVMSMTEVRVGTGVYQFLSVDIEQRTSDSVTARFRVRMTNNGRFPANFSDANFRLLIDGVPREPNSGLNEVVSVAAAKDAEVSFIVPMAARSTVLRVLAGGESADIVVELPPPPRAH